MSDPKQPNSDSPPMIVYGHDYCLQAKLLAGALEKHGIVHEWRDIYKGPADYQTELKALANGNLSVPTVIFADDTVMVEPWPNQVLKKLGVNKPGFFEKIIKRLTGQVREDTPVSRS